MVCQLLRSEANHPNVASVFVAMANTWCAMHGCRPFRGEAGHPSVANEFAAIIHILCTARGRVDDIWHVRGGRGHSASRFTLAAGSSYRAPFHARRGTFRATFRCPVSRLPRVVLGRHSASHFTLAAGYLGAYRAPFHARRGPFRATFRCPVSRLRLGAIPRPFRARCGILGCHAAPRFRLAAGPVGRHSAAPFHACSGFLWAPFHVPFHVRCGVRGCHSAPRFTLAACFVRAAFRCPVSRLPRGRLGAIPRPVSRSLREPWVPYRAPFHVVIVAPNEDRAAPNDNPVWPLWHRMTIL